jgi:dTDP-4-amino-4,6-dideoxygalactose transaminase
MIDMTNTNKTTQANQQLPLIPLTKPTLDEETIAAVAEVLRSGWITSGPQVAKFEAQLSEYFGGRPVRCFANGTATMEIALRIAGIGPGDEVITTPISWVATSNVILTVGAKPIFVDIDPETRNLDLNLVRAAITPKTKAIMPVYLAGLPMDLDKLYGLAKEFGLRVIEDAAQALGSTWNGQRVGSSFEGRSDLVSFSFQANKNLTSIEGGCLVMNTVAEASLAERLRLQGVTRTGMDGMEVDVLGGKHNLTDVNAVIGIKQFERLAGFQKQRQALAKEYFSLLKPYAETFGLQLPMEDFEHSNWHMFQLVLDKKYERAAIMTSMKAAQVGSGVHYPIITSFKLYKDLGYSAKSTPIAEQVGKSILSLPLYPLMSTSDLHRVVKALIDALKSQS